jgi:hypothetical protein
LFFNTLSSNPKIDSSKSKSAISQGWIQTEQYTFSYLEASSKISEFVSGFVQITFKKPSGFSSRKSSIICFVSLFFAKFG